MADNVTLGTMSGGDNVAADDIGGIKFQRVKLIYGADGVNSGDVATTNGIPVQNDRDVKSATISSGQSLSSAIDIAGHEKVAIQMPSSWTTANLTFQGSYDGSTYANIYDAAGNELSVIASTDRCITDIPELGPFRYIKIRSGTTGTPVVQGSDRTLQVIVKS